VCARHSTSGILIYKLLMTIMSL